MDPTKVQRARGNLGLLQEQAEISAPHAPSENQASSLHLRRRTVKVCIQNLTLLIFATRVLEKERQEIEEVRSMEDFGLDRNVTFERYMDLDEVNN